MIRLGDYKYVVFRNGDPLLYNVRTDPGESMDFDAAERDRLVRDGKLKEQYPFMLETGDCLNQFIFPDGRVIEADDTLYRPRVLAEKAEDVLMGRGR